MVDDESEQSGGILDNDLVKLSALGAAFAYWSGAEIPEWSILALSGLVVAGIGALLATGKIEALLPDPPRVRIVRINSQGDGLACWSLSPDKFADTQVEWGPLYPHRDAHGEVYEAYAYDPDRNVAVGTWRRSIPGSEIVGNHDIDDVLRTVGELRNELEPSARRFDELRTAMPAIVRRIKFDTMQAQDAALDPGRPMITDQPSVDDIITSELPEELRPGRLQNGDLRDLLEAGEEQEQEFDGEGLQLVVNADDLDDDRDAIPAEPMRNDGGQEQ